MRLLITLLLIALTTQASASCSIVTLQSCTTEELCKRGLTNYNDWRDRTNKFVEEAMNRGVDCRTFVPSPKLQTPSANTASADSCAQLGETARVVMQNRQAGASLSGLMEIAQGNELFVQMILTAYEQPRWNTSENKNKAAEDFANEVMLSCYKAKY